MATHSSVLAWRIPWTEEPGGLQSMGSQTVGHDVTLTFTRFGSYRISSCHILCSKISLRVCEENVLKKKNCITCHDLKNILFSRIFSVSNTLTLKIYKGVQ